MKFGRSSYQFSHVYLTHGATVVGSMEGQGSLGNYFDEVEIDPYFGQKSWEQAEIKMNERVVRKLLEKGQVQEAQVDLAIGGDLVNQLVPSNYAMRQFDIPFLGVYSACASAVEAMILGSQFVDSGAARQVLTFASSHTNGAEKQFRMPVEYGGPKGMTAQYTAMGAGAGLLASTPAAIKVESATIGTVIDAMQNNPADMGSAMAPAAAETICRHLKDLGRNANYYDLIVTGDLSDVGSPILIDLLKREGYDVEKIHADCGKLLYKEHQPTFAGASGAGCVSIVTFSYIMDLLQKKEVNNVLVVGTGALLNSLIVTQKETIPCIAHAISLTVVHEGGTSS